MWFLNIIYYIVPFIVLLAILVFVHEFGHFIVARLLGVKVSAFSIGFGKELWGFDDKHGTHWKISAVPLGGYCQFLGDGDASSSTSGGLKDLSEEEKKHAFAFQSPYKKLMIALAGPAFNYLLAILIYFAFFAVLGKFTIPPVIGELMEGGAAAEAGLEKGDRILTINGQNIADFSDISKEVMMAADQKVFLTLKRGDDILEYHITLTELDDPKSDGQPKKRYMLGVRSVGSVEISHQRLSVLEALKASTLEVWDVTETTLRGVWQMITGKRSSEDVGGVIRIAEMTGDISKTHSLTDFVLFLALLSINLGLINLFPIPILDGGHVLICILEIMIGHEIKEKAKEYLFKAGFLVLLALMVFATSNDIVH
ncbi:MAG: RIP metalloprotease RseP, partial [Alphaproteobacteria bacterium]|nr:RIP metalloprotease RseP [Alphaproteobacteria bacterium]